MGSPEDLAERDTYSTSNPKLLAQSEAPDSALASLAQLATRCTGCTVFDKMAARCRHDRFLAAGPYLWCMYNAAASFGPHLQRLGRYFSTASEHQGPLMMELRPHPTSSRPAISDNTAAFPIHNSAGLPSHTHGIAPPDHPHDMFRWEGLLWLHLWDIRFGCRDCSC